MTANAAKAGVSVIAVVAQKGGVGKTTVAANLAAAYYEAGVPVALLDTDPQGSAVTWAKHGEAMGVGPGLLAEIAHKINASDPRRLRAAVDAAVKAGARRVIIDGPPSFARPALAAALVADVVLIPAGPSALDLIPAGATLDIVKEAKAQRRGRGPQVYFVPTSVTPTKLGRELPGGLRALGADVLPGFSRRSSFATATVTGRTVVEKAPRSEAANEARALMRAIERRRR